MAETPNGKRFSLNMRTTKEVRALMDEAARRSGRSLSQEVEYRLQRSFDREIDRAEMLAAIREVVAATS